MPRVDVCGGEKLQKIASDCGTPVEVMEPSGFVYDPVPRHEADITQMLYGLGEILVCSPRSSFVLAQDPSLFQFVEQEPDRSWQFVRFFVALERFECFALQLPFR